jgi:hypothetical protein
VGVDHRLLGFLGFYPPPPPPRCGARGEGLFTVAFALGQSLLLSSRPRRRSLSLLVQWSPVSRLEFVISQHFWCGGSSFLREWSWGPVCKGM